MLNLVFTPQCSDQNATIVLNLSPVSRLPTVPSSKLHVHNITVVVITIIITTTYHIAVRNASKLEPHEIALKVPDMGYMSTLSYV